MDQMSNGHGTEEDQDRVPNRVREMRENKLMTQAQLARKAKVALRTIHSVEKGMNCRMDTKRKILLALGLRFEDKELVFPSNSPLAAALQQHQMHQHPMMQPQGMAQSHPGMPMQHRPMGSSGSDDPSRH